MKNETEDFMALAKAYAQAERALRIERWVIVTFELRKTDGPIEILYRYDLPRTMLERYDGWYAGARLVFNAVSRVIRSQRHTVITTNARD